MSSPHRIRALVAPCVLGVALAVAPSLARAQSAPAPSPSPISEIGRITTSDRQEEPLGATARTTYVVTKNDMLLHGDDTVAAAIARVPGVFVQRTGALGATSTVSIRGQRGDGILVLLDGRAIAGAQLGAVDIGAMPTTGIERIEIVEGSGSTLYGTGASAGIINIITSRSRAAYRTPVVSIAGGSYGYGHVALETSTFSFSRDIAANTYDASYAGLPPGSTRVNADLSSTNARLTDGGTFGHLRVTGSAGFVSRILGVPGSTSFLTTLARQQDDTSDARLNLALVHPQSTLSLDLSASRETLTYLDPSVSEGGPFLDFSTDARVQANLRNNVVSDANRLVYGADFSRGVARNDGSSALGPAIATLPYAQAGIYVQDSVALGHGSSIYGGVRGERDGAAGGAITPSIGGIVAFGNALTLRLNAGTAYRVPTATDLAFPGFSNPTLVPERTQSFDATIGLLDRASIGWFVQTGTNLITLNPNVDFTQPFGPGNQPLINQQQSSAAGFVFDASTKRLNGIAARFNLTDTYRAFAYNPGVAAARLPDRPVFASSLDLGYTGQQGSVLAAVGAVAHTVGLLTGGAGNYTTVDGYVRLRVGPQALLSLRVYDFGNARYEDVSGYPMPGRTFTAELSTR
jgi:vitamin B12 transporter